MVVNGTYMVINGTQIYIRPTLLIRQVRVNCAPRQEGYKLTEKAQGGTTYGH